MNFFRVNSKLILGQLIVLITMLMMLEAIMRIIGYKPGDMKPNWLNFHPVDTLIDMHPLYVNEKGFVVANEKEIGIPGIYINEDGFRNKEFDSISGKKKKLLLLGDSFTWGMSAQPIDSCYADILGRESGYEVINTGISGTDIYQYEGIAKWLVPEIKPDIVLLFFFVGNDLVKKPRTLIPFKPLYYYTNAGSIDAEIDNKYFSSAKDAYYYIMEEKYYMGNPKNVFEWCISKSVILSRLYSLRFRLKEKMEYENRLNDLYLTTSVLDNIKSICENNSAKLMFISIPEIKEADMTIEQYRAKYNNLFNHDLLKDYWRIPQCEKSWFNPYPDAHLNNKGHRAYADFVMKCLKEQP